MIDPEKLAVIVGVGRLTGDKKRRRASRSFGSAGHRCDGDDGNDGDDSPVGMLRAAAMLAAKDAVEGSNDVEKNDDLAKRLLADVVAIGTPGMFLELRWLRVFGKRPFVNFPRAVGDAIGASRLDDSRCIRAYDGGNGPMYLVSYFADLISRAEVSAGPILVGGAEMNGTFDAAVRARTSDKLEKDDTWTDTHRASVRKPVDVNLFAKPNNGMEKMLLGTQYFHSGLPPALTLYPLLEIAYGHAKNRSANEQAEIAAGLFSRFSSVAAAHPEHSWYPKSWSKAELLRVTKDNRMIGYPYRKNMCARDEVDQAAAILMMSWAEAIRRGISSDKIGECTYILFLHFLSLMFPFQFLFMERAMPLTPTFSLCANRSPIVLQCARLIEKHLDRQVWANQMKRKLHCLIFIHVFPLLWSMRLIALDSM